MSLAIALGGQSRRHGLSHSAGPLAGATPRGPSPGNRGGLPGVCTLKSRTLGADAHSEGGIVTGNDSDPTDNTTQPETPANPPASARRSLRRAAMEQVRAHGRIARVLALIAVAAVVGTAYIVGSPPTADVQRNSALFGVQSADGVVAMPAATAAGVPEPGKMVPAAAPTSALDGSSGIAGTVPTTDQGQVLTAAEAAQIVKTGQMTLEVNDIDAALTNAQSTIAKLGGYVDSSSRDGTGDQATASITFRVPVGQWDAALSALHKVGTKVLSEQTGSSDVTAQVVDLNARLTNLKTTEAALQAIMGRAIAIADVIAVETQLSNVQGQIEEITAEINQLKNQAAMSTLTVTFQLPAQTVTTQATQDWTIGNQIDQAGAALVRIGQGLATIGVWILIVVLPLSIAALLLFGILALGRRIFGRARRRDADAGA